MEAEREGTSGPAKAAVERLLARAHPKLRKDDCPPSVVAAAVPLIARAPPGSGTDFVARAAAGELV